MVKKCYHRSFDKYTNTSTVPCIICGSQTFLSLIPDRTYIFVQSQRHFSIVGCRLYTSLIKSSKSTVYNASFKLLVTNRASIHLF